MCEPHIYLYQCLSLSKHVLCVIARSWHQQDTALIWEVITQQNIGNLGIANFMNPTTPYLLELRIAFEVMKHFICPVYICQL
jgi:hypothetical protein